MTPQEISTLMRALGRIEGRLAGVEGELKEHGEQLSTLTGAAERVQAVAEWRERHRVFLITAVGAVVGALGTVGALAGYFASHLHP